MKRHKGFDNKGRPGWYNTDGTFTRINPETGIPFKSNQEMYRYYRNDPNKRFDLIQEYYNKFRTRQRRINTNSQLYHDYDENAPKIHLYNPKIKGKENGIYVNTSLIDSIAAHKPANMNIYRALALPAIETDFGNKLNLSQFEGNVRNTLNNHGYELGDMGPDGKVYTNTYRSAYGTALRRLGYNQKQIDNIDSIKKRFYILES